MPRPEAAADGVRASFRDPLGQVQLVGGRVVRYVREDASRDLEKFLALASVQDSVRQGDLIATESVESSAPTGYRSYEHPRIPFPSYASEWPPELLHSAAGLTLRLSREMMPWGYGLKDATPSNVLFQGVKPTFIDVLSFEQREKTDPIWLAAGQFERAFLVPLLAWKYLRIPPNQLLTTNRDGVVPEVAAHWFGGAAKFRRDYQAVVGIPAALSRRAKERNGDAQLAKSREVGEEAASFVLRSTYKRLGRLLQSVAPQTAESRWRGYMQSHSYDPKSFAAKENFVREALDEVHPAWVLDVGCNTGHFSALAARSGSSVVAIDSDIPALDEACRMARRDSLDILPLSVDITRPTPATGWLNAEQSSFLSRSVGRFDLVLMLAVVHHMLVTERIPLDQILDLTKDLTRGAAIVEFVSPQDPMFRSISTARSHLFSDLNEKGFEALASERFKIVRSLPLNEGLRRIYLLRSK